MAKTLTHVDARGRARMVDVGAKPSVRRVAVAEGFIALPPAALRAVRDNTVKKGDVLAVAQVAGIQAAKLAPALIPLCHTLRLDHVDVRLEVRDAGIAVVAEASCRGPTGVEMEALVAADVALLAVWDMCKALDKETRAMRIDGVRLVSKHKGAR